MICNVPKVMFQKFSASGEGADEVWLSGQEDKFAGQVVKNLASGWFEFLMTCNVPKVMF